MLNTAWFYPSKLWNKANKCLNQFFAMGKQNTKLAVYRAGRLLHILLCYEQDDMEYLEYEIRSYKRAFSKLGRVFKTEKLIFNAVAADLKRRGNAWKETTRKKIAAKRFALQTEKREMQLLKYFDFGEWVLEQHQ